MKKAIGMVAAMMMAAAAGSREFYDTGLYRKPARKMSAEDRHKLYGQDLTEHEFTIKGEKIIAHDKKTAMKIYANRHPESKKRKKK